MNDIEIMVTCPSCGRDNHAAYDGSLHGTYIYCPHCRILDNFVADIDLVDASDAIRRMLKSMIQLGLLDDLPKWMR